MSSSSSSECLCPDCFRYGNANNGTNAPFYQTMGHPLIYYAQVEPQPCIKRGKGSKDDNPNCFVKAFRWYTQELYSQKTAVPQAELPDNRGELPGFATWLDKKYDQYLKDRGFQDLTRLDSAHPCMANKINTGGPCELRAPKKPFARPLSPWGKKRRQVQNKERGCTLDKSHHSFEFILEPKDLSRPTSECCQQSSVSNRSAVVTAASSDTQASKKTIIKCQSTEKNVSYHKRANNILNGKGKCEGDCAIKDPEAVQIKSSAEKNNPPLNMEKIKKSAVDFECQCPGEENYWIADAQTQYDVTDCKLLDRCSTTCAFNPPLMPVLPPPPPPRSPPIPASAPMTKNSPLSSWKSDNHLTKPKPSKNRLARIDSTASCQCMIQFRPKVDTASQYHHNGRKTECSCAKQYEKYVKNPIIVPKKKQRNCVNCPNCLPRTPQRQHSVILMDPPKLEDIKPICNICHICSTRTYEDAAQTSDHSIDLDAACDRKYPFFMKIICADKLKEELAHQR